MSLWLLYQLFYLLVYQFRHESGGMLLAVPDRAFYLPTFSHLLIVHKLLSLSDRQRYGPSTLACC